MRPKQSENININTSDNEFIQRCIDFKMAMFEGVEGTFANISYKSYNDDAEYGSNIFMKHRYGEFLNLMAEKTIDSKYCKIMYNCNVKTIEFNKLLLSSNHDININSTNNNNAKVKQQQSTSSVTVTYNYCNDDDKKIQGQIDCEYVIVCVPISCLQNRNIQFIPDLTKYTWNVIDNGFAMCYIQIKFVFILKNNLCKNNDIATFRVINKQPPYKNINTVHVNTTENKNETKNENVHVSPLIQYKLIPGMYQKYNTFYRVGAGTDMAKKYNIWTIFISPQWSKYRKLNWGIYHGSVNDESNCNCDEKEKELKQSPKTEKEKNKHGNNDDHDHCYPFASDKEIMDDVLEKFQEIFFDSDSNFDKNKNKNKYDYFLSTWHKDPLSLGSWCYWKKGSNGKKDCIYLSDGIKNSFVENNVSGERKLFFAGEYCCYDGIGTVGGAFQTGVNAASKVVAMLKRKL